MLSIRTLPEKLAAQCLDVLKKLLLENELVRVVVEIIQDMRDEGYNKVVGQVFFYINSSSDIANALQMPVRRRSGR